MDKKTAFIGHRKVYYSDKVKERLEAAIAEQIKEGCRCFVMGTHGEFDSMALSACRKARDTYPDIEIDVVLTSYHKVEKKDEFDYVPYQDVNTFMYDIEDEHFKRQIIVSNRKMMDDCDTLICYVDKKQNPSGAKIAMNYAKRHGLKIMNIYREDDSPTFYMSEKEKKAYWDNLFAKYRDPKQ